MSVDDAKLGVVPEDSGAKPSPNQESDITKETAVFAAWDRSLFVDSKVSRRVKAVIDAGRGGNYALTAPRGAGKSWLLQQAIYWASDNDQAGKKNISKGAAVPQKERRDKQDAENGGSGNGLGILFPSPSQDTPEAFLAALSEVLAQSYIDYYIAQRKLSSTPEGLRQSRQQLMLLSVGIYLGAALLFLGISGKHLPGLSSSLSRAGLVIVLGSAFMFLFLAVRTRGKPKSVYEVAIDFRRQSRFAAVISKSSGFSGNLSQLGASVGINTSQEASFTERPVTLSSLVYSFREFCTQLVKALAEAPLVIAIDELDKIEDPNEVIRLLRGVKGIFDIPGVYYFVSISDEAARRLELGGIRGRAEFNSSFYQVFQLSRVNLDAICELLNRRGVELEDSVRDSIIAAVTVLSSGIPREVVRLVDVIVNSVSSAEDSPELVILSTEVAAFREETETNQDKEITQEDRVWVGYELSEHLNSRASFLGRDFYQSWEMPNTSDAFREEYREDFRRLLNRLTVGRNLMSVHQPLTSEAIMALQSVMVANDRASGVGFTALRNLDKNLNLLGVGQTEIKSGDVAPQTETTND